MRRSPRLVYICLERLVEGSAAATHVAEICRGLSGRGFTIALKAERGTTRGGLARQLARYARILAAGAAALRRADAVYIRSHFAAFPLALLARALGRAVIHEINGAYEDAFVTHPRFGRLRRVLSLMQRAQYRSASALVAVTPDLVAWGRAEAGHERVFLVSNGADTELFRPDGERAVRERPYVIFFGGLVRWHGVEVMIDAVRSPLWPAGTDLVVAGPIVDGSLRPVLDARPANVIWLGPLAQTELPPLIRGALAVLVPISDPSGRSSHGVMPLKLFEGLACGVPAVVTDLPGQADLVRGAGCGLVVPTGDADRLAAAVAALAADPARARRMGERGARLVAAEHSWAMRAAETARIIAEAVTRSR